MKLVDAMVTTLEVPDARPEIYRLVSFVTVIINLDGTRSLSSQPFRLGKLSQ